MCIVSLWYFYPNQLQEIAQDHDDFLLLANYIFYQLYNNLSIQSPHLLSNKQSPDYIQQSNIFGVDSKTIVPKQEFTNTKNNAGSENQAGLVINTGSLKWAKYL